MSLRAGGDPADQNNLITEPEVIQESASVTQSTASVQSPESESPIVRVEVGLRDRKPAAFRLKFGLFASGGDRE
jgi:hypothetical protein